MSAHYRLTPLTDVQPGMILSDVLLDRIGQVLLTKGAVLTAASIASIGRHGIGMVPVLLDQVDEPPDAAAVKARLDYLFRKQTDDEAGAATAALHRYVEDFRLEREVAP
ncbi:MAG TPA: hypothetical protein VNT33_02415 [Telluria sp.]|nr:hypothetical protein [Telluria sp.]